MTLRALLCDDGGGSASGRPIKAVQVGGPLGTYLPESKWDVPLEGGQLAHRFEQVHGGRRSRVIG